MEIGRDGARARIGIGQRAKARVEDGQSFAGYKTIQGDAPQDRINRQRVVQRPIIGHVATGQAAHRKRRWGDVGAQAGWLRQGVVARRSTAEAVRRHHRDPGASVLRGERASLRQCHRIARDNAHQHAAAQSSGRRAVIDLVGHRLAAHRQRRRGDVGTQAAWLRQRVVARRSTAEAVRRRHRDPGANVLRGERASLRQCHRIAGDNAHQRATAQSGGGVAVIDLVGHRLAAHRKRRRGDGHTAHRIGSDGVVGGQTGAIAQGQVCRHSLRADIGARRGAGGGQTCHGQGLTAHKAAERWCAGQGNGAGAVVCLACRRRCQARHSQHRRGDDGGQAGGLDEGVICGSAGGQGEGQARHRHRLRLGHTTAELHVGARHSSTRSAGERAGVSVQQTGESRGA